jgi:signal transduction histidine kinase
LQFQATNGGALTGGASAQQEPQRDLPLIGHLLLPIAVFVISVLTIKFSHLSNHITALWPSNAVILVALLRCKRTLRNYGSIFVSSVCAIALANLVAGNSLALSAIFSITNTVEVATAVVLLSLFHVSESNLNTFRNLLIFIIIAGGVAPIGSNVVGGMAVQSAHGIPWQAMWRNSYPGHALGMVIVAPFLVTLMSNEWQAVRIRQRRGEALATLALVIVVTICTGYFRSFLFVFVPVILLATLRFGLLGATTAIFANALIFAGFIVRGIGEPLLTGAALPDRILALQLLLTLTALWALPIAALLSERDRLLQNLSLANSQLLLESERKSHMVMGLHRHLSTAEEKERLRLSHELHDQAGQSLIAAILELSEIDSMLGEVARRRLHSVRQRMEEMGKTLHRIAWELRPPLIDELGLRKALASYVEDWGEQCGTAVDFHCEDPSIDGIANDIGSAVFRVVQEALTNIVKHAQKPSSVSVVVRRVAKTLQIIVEDDGCGFDVGAAAATAGHNRGLGLDGMRERLLLIGGTLEIESATGTGTTIFARIPLDDQWSAA